MKNKKKFKKIVRYAYHCGNTDFFNWVKTRLMTEDGFSPSIDREQMIINYTNSKIYKNDTLNGIVKYKDRKEFMKAVAEYNVENAEISKEYNKEARKFIKNRLVPKSWIEEFESQTREFAKGAGTCLGDLLKKVLPKKEKKEKRILMNGAWFKESELA